MEYPPQPPQTQYPLPQWHMGPFPSPPASNAGDVSYSTPFLQQQQQPQQPQQPPGTLDQQQPQDLRLNLAGLNATSPSANVSPINPAVANALPPVTPLSPAYQSFSSDASTTPTALGSGASASYDESGHHNIRLTPSTHSTIPSLSRSTSSSSLPRKRSFTSPSTPSVVEEESDTPMDISGADSDMSLFPPGGGTSPGEGPSSPIDADDPGSTTGTPSFNAIGGKPSVGGGVNNFVTKLYQMIIDPKSSQYISWTELGTSFVVSNVGEFSRTILGSHFKHNNFSSFVRQLNMYGFHKINRTPRAQRTTSDSQTWEFSHHKFLRNRPDLLDEIKRKALEPDPMGVKMRLELPGEVAAQISSLREETAKMYELWKEERRKNERLVFAVAQLWDTVGASYGLPQFPADLLDCLPDQANLFPSNAQQSMASNSQPQLGHQHPPTVHSQRLTTLVTPTTTTNSSPVPSPTGTGADQAFFHHHTPLLPPQHHRHQYPLSRQHSFQQLSSASFSGGRSDPPSPGPAEDMFGNAAPNGGASPLGMSTGGGRLKRQRTLEPLTTPSAGLNGVSASSTTGDAAGSSSTPPTGSAPIKKMSRARSDSAPLGLGYHSQPPPQLQPQQSSYHPQQPSQLSNSGWGYPPPLPTSHAAAGLRQGMYMNIGGTSGRARSGSVISPPPPSMIDG